MAKGGRKQSLTSAFPTFDFRKFRLDAGPPRSVVFTYLINFFGKTMDANEKFILFLQPG